MKSIAIIGYGYIGRAMVDLFNPSPFSVVIYDPKLMQVPARDLVNSCDLSIVCVPTPMAEDGSVCTSIVEEVIDWLDTPVIVIKSTVPPGTSMSLSVKTGKRIVFSPEFISESSYVIPWWKGYPHGTDIRYHDFQIFGGDKKDTHYVVQFFKRVLGPSVVYSQVDHATAELTKYMHNAWGATKVTFANEFFEIAKVFGVDYDALREVALLNGFMERMHTAVFEDARGFGGKCLPKDVNGIAKASEGGGYVPELLRQVIKSNETFTAKNVDVT